MFCILQLPLLYKSLQFLTTQFFFFHFICTPHESTLGDVLLLYYLLSAVTDLLSPLPLIANQQVSPMLRSQFSVCSTFHAMCDDTSTAVVCKRSTEYFRVSYLCFGRFYAPRFIGQKLFFQHFN